MNGLNNSVDDVAECPLCMEPLEVDDLNFYPCTCGYQICRFCWHRIRTDENELCPACRKEYPENPADFTPLTQEEMIAFKSQKRQRDQQRKQKITENRKHLANVRVVQKNLVFVVGLPPRLADADILKKHEYFGKYGKIHKVVINPSTTYAGVQGPSASAYVTYVHNSDALRAIQSVNNINIDGRLIKTSLGTTKYCSHFMKNQPCPKNDCMYLHELGDPEASFTKEEMHQGKHQEYEKRLHDALIATAGTNNTNGLGNLSGNQITPGLNGGLVNSITNSKNCELSKGPTLNSTSSSMSSSSSSGSSSSSTSMGTTNTNTNLSSVVTPDPQKDAWPSLLGAATNNKDITNPSAKSKKEKVKNERSKNDRKAKVKNNQNNNYKNSSSSTRINNFNANETDEITNQKTATSEIVVKGKAETIRERTSEKQQNKEKVCKEKSSLNLDEEIKLISEVENKSKYRSNKRDANNKPQTTQNSTEMRSSNSYVIERDSTDKNNKINNKRCNSSSSNASICSNNSSDSTSSLSDSVSGKSSPEQTERFIPEESCEYSKSDNHSPVNLDRSSNIYDIDTNIVEEIITKEEADLKLNTESSIPDNEDAADVSCNVIRNKNNSNIANLSEPAVQKTVSTCNSPNNLLMETTDALLKLNVFEDNNSFFSSNTAASNYTQSLLLKNKPGLASDIRQNQLNSVISSHLPDLLSGIDGNQNSTNDWEEAFKNVILRSNKQMEEQLQKQHYQQQQQQHQIHYQQQEDFLRIQELQKRNSLLNNMGIPQLNGTHNDFSNNYHSGGGADLNRIVQSNMSHQHQHPSQQQILPQSSQQQQQQQQQARQQSSTEHLLENSHFGHNMSKFFDFHKNQQQQQQLQQQFLINNNTSGLNSVNDHLRMGSFLDNNHISSQFLDQNNIIPPQQQIVQKQRVHGKFDSMGPVHSPQVPLQKPQQQQAHQQVHPLAQFPQTVSVEDDLGFDPFIETQKGLAELMENEVVQQQSSNNSSNGVNATTSMASKFLQQQQQQQLLENMQRARMPPPGFNHVNSFNSFGSTSRLQNTSKILPFVNGPGGPGGLGGMANTNSHLTSQQQQPQQQMQMPLPWNLQMNAYQPQQQQQLLNDSQLHQMQNHHQNTVNHKGYSSNDWTAMDPAILSLRQFSSFSQQPPPPPLSQHHASPAQDLFMQHLPHQQNNQGFVSQQSLQNNSNLSSGLLGVQQTAQPQAFNCGQQFNWFSNESKIFSNANSSNAVCSNTCDNVIKLTSAVNHPEAFNTKQQKMDNYNC